MTAATQAEPLSDRVGTETGENLRCRLLNPVKRLCGRVLVAVAERNVVSGGGLGVRLLCRIGVPRRMTGSDSTEKAIPLIFVFLR